MFTGVVEEKGKIVKSKPNQGGFELTIEAVKVLEGCKLGDSIAVNGVCLTVTSFTKTTFTIDLSSESILRTGKQRWQVNRFVNLERALLVGGRIHGHFVSGHVDGTGKIEAIAPEGEFYTLKVRYSDNLAPYISEKGSVTLDGISLTVAYESNNILQVAVIPHTYKETTLCELSVGDSINIEVDMMARMLEKIVKTGKKEQNFIENLAKL